MIRNRLTRLEKLAAERASNCPGCGLMPAVGLLPGEPEPPGTVRCGRCGRERPPAGVRIVVPGIERTTDGGELTDDRHEANRHGRAAGAFCVPDVTSR
jgi:hypothetical protein